MLRRRRPAFTLIELLTVIAIIAVLAGIIFPVFAQAREKARQTTCTSNLRQLDMAFLQYTEDYDESLPGSYNGDYGLDTGKIRVGGWIYYSEFVNDAPNRKDFDPTLGSIYPYVNNVRVYICPDDGPGDTVGDSYAINGCINEPPSVTTYFAAGKPLTKITNATGTMMLSEEGSDVWGVSTNDGYLALNYGNGGDLIANRHSNGVEVSFVDGHVKWYPVNSVHPLGLQTGTPGEIPGVTQCP